MFISCPQIYKKNLISFAVSQNDFTDSQVERGSYFYVFPVAFDKIDGMS